MSLPSKHNLLFVPRSAGPVEAVDAVDLDVIVLAEAVDVVVVSDVVFFSDSLEFVVVPDEINRVDFIVILQLVSTGVSTTSESDFVRDNTMFSCK